LKHYGIARVKFTSYSDWLNSNLRIICPLGSSFTGFILFNKLYFVPCRLPSKDELEDFFKKIASALVATSKKLKQDIPDWLDTFRFKKEEQIVEKQVLLEKELEVLRNEKDIYKKYKRSLCCDGELLVESVVSILRDGFGILLNEKKDEHIEDKIILDDSKEDKVLVEIKGMNDNVKSAHVYQADAHRGRREKASDFPSILIVNTFIKPANSIADKLKDVHSEQVKLAVEKKVLIIRTIDLLNLLSLHEENKLTKDELCKIFVNETGWLSVSNGSIDIRKT